MQQLKDRIQREGRVLPGNIIKVDGFLNHRVDTALMSDMADEFAKYFDVKDITMVLTAEASGIALATVCACVGFLPHGSELGLTLTLLVDVLSLVGLVQTLRGLQTPLPLIWRITKSFHPFT